MLRVHHGERLDIGEPVLAHALLRLAQHRLGIVDADDAVGARIVGQRDAGADADFEDAPADRARPPRSTPCGRASNTAPNTRS